MSRNDRNDRIDRIDEELLWDEASLDEAIELLARRLPGARVGEAIDRKRGDTSLGLRERVETAASAHGLEVEPVQTSYDELSALIAGGGPALVRCGERQLIVLLGGSARQVTLLGRDQREQRLATSRVVEALRAPIEAMARPAVETLLERSAIRGRRSRRAAKLLIRERLRGFPLPGAFLLRVPAGAAVGRPATASKLPRLLGVFLGVFLGAHGLHLLLSLAAWALIGRGALEGTLQASWLYAWLLLLGTLLPLALLSSWAKGRLALDAGVLLERRLLSLLTGALRLGPDTREEDLALAKEVCRELGLGELLDRMPGGLHQVVGDTGWRLPHGEQSRVFLARALLQDADAVLLDESFGALDPKSAARAARCVLERARTVVAIAHP